MTNIYDNYNLEDMTEETRQYLIDEYPEDGEPSEEQVWNEIYHQDEFTWDDEYTQLCNFFNGKNLICFGFVGLWDGTFSGGKIFNGFEDLFRSATESCEYWKLWDDGGHLFLKCSHHDGTNLFEIKCVSELGCNLQDKWEYNWNDKRSQEDIHNIIIGNNLFSSLPHYCKNVYGTKE